MVGLWVVPGPVLCASPAEGLRAKAFWLKVFLGGVQGGREGWRGGGGCEDCVSAPARHVCLCASCTGHVVWQAALVGEKGVRLGLPPLFLWGELPTLWGKARVVLEDEQMQGRLFYGVR